jgi:hypothetical protein
MNEARLHFLANELAFCKAEEDRAKEARIKAEEDIWAELIADGEEPCRLGSSKTLTEAGFRISIKRPLNYSIDEAAWDEIREKIDEAYLAAVEYKPRVVERAAKWIEQNDPAEWTRMSRAITVKPGKVSISATELITEEE